MSMKNGITIKEVIEFVRKAMTMELDVDFNEDIYNEYFWFRITNVHNKTRIHFQITPGKNSLEIGVTKYGGSFVFPMYDSITIKDCHISEREVLDIRNLYLDCREHSANNAYSAFKNFFKQSEDLKPININDLDNDEE